ncbi:MAG: hypothetical protein ACYTG4_12490 [Planctomycetota bacterium]
MRIPTMLLLAAGLLAVPPVELTEKNYASTRDTILPSKSEAAWQSIPWRASLWSAAVEAHEARKPILLWAMNGHPLACT